MTDVRALARWSSERSIPSAIAASVLAVAVLILGPAMVGLRPTKGFLLWNLFLAWVPFVAAVLVERFESKGRRAPALAAGAVWLLFLPNAPYLVSDLTHLPAQSATPWLDLARLVAFAWAGCLLAVASLRLVHRIVAGHAGAVAGWVVVGAACVLSGVGVAMGRFARLNSWEVFTSPTTVASETVRLFGTQRAVAVAAFFALFVLVTYTGFGGAHRTPTAR